jgi:hypothetical protein
LVLSPNLVLFLHFLVLSLGGRLPNVVYLVPKKNGNYQPSGGVPARACSYGLYTVR